MKEINIAGILAAKRREKGLTQEDLASYMGVSKASVSKWETGQSYPDITFLPQLAAYFNISIDELMGYSPQMEKDEIRKLYLRLCNDFSKKPFYKVWGECNEITKKYYSCFPLLLQMALLLLNHHMLDQKEANKVLEECVVLCTRVKDESGDSRLSEQAVSILSGIYLVMNRPEDVIALLPEPGESMHADNSATLANAYLMTGNTKKAKETIQISLLTSLLYILSSGPLLMALSGGDSEREETILRRLLSLASLFEVERLSANPILLIYLSAAQAYLARGAEDKALDFLEKYGDLCGRMSFTLHGDSFFDSIDDWITALTLGNSAPRNESVIRESMVQAITCNPAFATLAGNQRLEHIIEKLKKHMGGSTHE